MGNRPCAPRVVINNLSLGMGIASKKLLFCLGRLFEIFSLLKVLSINGLSEVPSKSILMSFLDYLFCAFFILER